MVVRCSDVLRLSLETARWKACSGVGRFMLPRQRDPGLHAAAERRRRRRFSTHAAAAVFKRRIGVERLFTPNAPFRDFSKMIFVENPTFRISLSENNIFNHFYTSSRYRLLRHFLSQDFLRSSDATL